MVIDDAMRSIERVNHRLNGHIAQNFARPELDKRCPGDDNDIERLTSELSGLFTKSHEQEEEYRKRQG